MGAYLDDEAGIEGHADPCLQRDGGYHAACFRAGQCGLGQACAGGQFDLGQAHGQAAFADGLADQAARTAVPVDALMSGATTACLFRSAGSLGPPGRN